MWTPQNLCEIIQQSQSNYSPLEHGDLLLQSNQSITYLGNEEEIPLVTGPDIRGLTLFSYKNEATVLSPLEGFNIPDSRLGGSFTEDTTFLSAINSNKSNSLMPQTSHFIRKNVLSIGDHLPTFSSAKSPAITYLCYNIIPTQILSPVSFTEAQSLLSNYVILTNSLSLSPLLVHCSPPSVGETFSLIGAHSTPNPDRKVDAYRTHGLIYKGIKSRHSLLKERDIVSFLTKECHIPIADNCQYRVTSKYDTVYFSNNYRVYITAEWSNPKCLLSTPPLDFLPSINFEITLTSKHSLQSLQFRELSFLKNLLSSNTSLVSIGSMECENIYDLSQNDGISKCLEQISSASPDATFIQQDCTETRPLLDCTEIIWCFVRQYCTTDLTPLANLLTSLIEGIIACEITPYFQPDNCSYLATLIRESSTNQDTTSFVQDISDTAKLNEIVTEIGILKLLGDYIYKLSVKSVLSGDNVTQKFHQFDVSKKLRFLTLLHTLCEIGIISESHLKLSGNEIKLFLCTLYDHFVNNISDFDINTTSRLTYHLKQRSASTQTLHDICSRVPCFLWHLETDQEKNKFSVSFVNRELFQSTGQVSQELLNPYYFYLQRITSCISRKSAS